MPLYFQLDQLTTITDEKKAVASINNINKPKVLSFKKGEMSIEKIACINTGEGLLLHSDQKEHTLIATTGTSSCLQAYFFNQDTRCLLHFNKDFEIEWASLLSQFKNNKINLILIGATLCQNSAAKSFENLNIFFTSLLGYLNKNDKFTITLIAQQVLKDNFNSESLFFKTEHIAKLPNLGFDVDGKLYDLSSIRSELKDFPLVCHENEKKEVSELRNARQHEGEHRAWLSKKFGCYCDKAPILLMTSSMTAEMLKKKTYFDRLTIKFAEELSKIDKINFYCDFITKAHYEDLTKLEAKEFNQSIKSFFKYILQDYAITAANYKVLVNKNPDAPWSLVLMSYKYDYNISGHVQNFIEVIEESTEKSNQPKSPRLG